MEKDIRHYDMKEVVFEQDRADKRLLILEVGVVLLFLKLSCYRHSS